MIQRRDLFKIILAVVLIITLVIIAVHYATSSGGASLSGENPKLVISGMNSNGAVPGLENYSFVSGSTKKSNYTNLLESKYKSRQPVNCRAGSDLTFSFPDGEPDKLRAYFTYYRRSEDKSSIFSDEYEVLVYNASLTLPTDGMDFPVFPVGIYSSYVMLPKEHTSVVFFHLVATWGEENREYAFAVNLEDTSEAAQAE